MNMKIVKVIIALTIILSLNAADNDNNQVKATYNPANRETTYRFNNIQASHIPPNIYEAFEVQSTRNNFQRLVGIDDPMQQYLELESMFKAQNEPNEAIENVESDELE